MGKHFDSPHQNIPLYLPPMDDSCLIQFHLDVYRMQTSQVLCWCQHYQWARLNVMNGIPPILKIYVDVSETHSDY